MSWTTSRASSSLPSVARARRNTSPEWRSNAAAISFFSNRVASRARRSGTITAVTAAGKTVLDELIRASDTWEVAVGQESTGARRHVMIQCGIPVD